MNLIKDIPLTKSFKFDEIPIKDSIVANARPERAAMLDPFSYLNIGRYKSRRTGLSFEMLRKMATKCSVIAAIIRTRLNQVASFSIPARDVSEDNRVGFEIAHVDPDHKTTKSERKEILDFERYIVNTGINDINPETGLHRDNFNQFLRKTLNDSLIYDQLAFELIPTRKDVRIPALFQAVDASTIRFALQKDKQEKTRENKSNNYPISYVQVMQGQVRVKFNAYEMAMCIRNPRTQIESNGYGFSELELLINTITSQLWAEQYNQKFFSQGFMPKGVLNLKGEYIHPDMMEAFRRQCTAMLTGVTNAWKIPLFNSEGLEYVNLQSSNSEMEYSRWMEYLIKISCAMYQINPSEINFDLSQSGDSRPIFESNNEAKIKHSKDKGLLPLLQFFSTCINRHIVQRINPNYVFKFMGLGRISPAEEQELLDKQVRSYRTVNEIRKAKDQSSVEHGDIILDSIYIQYRMAKEQAGQEGGVGEGEEGEMSEEDFQKLLRGETDEKGVEEETKTEKSLGKSKYNDYNLVKARVHKYIKRTGSPGNYEYTYREDEPGVKGKIENITSDQYNKIEAKAWNDYNEKLKTVKNEKEADKLYQRYTLIEEEAHKRLYVDKKEPGEKIQKPIAVSKKPEIAKAKEFYIGKRKADSFMSGNTRILAPKDLNKKRQQLTVRDIDAFLKQIPERHRGLIKEIRLLDDYYQEGTKKFKNSTATFDMENKFIEIYRNDRFSPDRIKGILPGTVRHEAGHVLEDSLQKTGFLKDWESAMKKDGKSITDFAKKDIHEDVAETLTYYWSDDSVERRTVTNFFEYRAGVLSKYNIQIGG